MPSPFRALECYDLLCCVFDQLAATEHSWYDYDVSTNDAHCWSARRADSHHRRTLARCARVCKAFFTPAVSVLWRDIDNVAHLIPAIRASEPFTAQNRLISPSSSRSLEYARYVRAIHGSGSTLSSRAQPYSAELLREGMSPFPHLRHMRWVQLVPSGMELLQIISPSLRSLHIVFQRAPESHDKVTLGDVPSVCETFVRDLLTGIVTKAPHLRYLRVSTTGDIKESWLESAIGFRELQTADLLSRIHSEVTTLPLLRSLASMHSLQHLKIRLPSEMSSLDVPCNVFPSLQTLTLDAMFSRLHIIADFISTITSEQLHSLSIQNCECTTSAVGVGIRTICNVIRARFASSLCKLELSLRNVGPIRRSLATHRQSFIHTIEPLLDMHNLEDVRIAIMPEAVTVAASEHDLEKIAQAWPNATRVHLCYFPSSVSPSLQDVATFAQRCPGLTDLVLPGIDASGPSSGVTLSADRVGSHACPSGPTGSDTKSGAGPHGLRSLSLSDNGWNSKIPDPTRLAGFLDTLFPGVEWRCPPLASDQWRETIEEVVRLRIARLL
ncbi:hypothetical protein C8Q80DRAFT_1275478 [Daedaleopsis nitida]|nr:hypothetical protein C8Q80DRAFT_1275478 [Daedaleopsis nitida]